MKTFDTHAHLDHLKDLDTALENARQAGIAGIVAMSMNLESCRKCLQIKQKITDPAIYLGMGTHPSDASLEELPDCLEYVREHVKELTVIGEIGLDFWYKWVRKDKVKKDEQRQVFRAFLELAKEFELPAVIHSRGCWRECFETANEMGINKAEFHWYSGPLDVLKDIVSRGYYVSAPPSLAYGEQLRNAISEAPVEQILIETDCPVYFKNPKTGEGFASEPRDVLKTLDAFCELKGMERDQAVQQLNQNAKQFFGITSEVI